jgi:hypothetical protein
MIFMIRRRTHRSYAILMKLKNELWQSSVRTCEVRQESATGKGVVFQKKTFHSFVVGKNNFNRRNIGLA